jgi:PST family polysaccharide transporter
MTYGTQNLDNLLIGRVLGPATLGLYVRSFSLVLTPSRQVTATIGQVMFSTLARVGDQRERTKRIYLRTIGALSFLTFPAMIGLAIVTDDFVRTAFGPDWVAAITVMRIFCVIGAVAPLAGTLGWIYQSQGRADLLLRWGIWAGGLYMASIVVGALFGSMEAVAIAVAVNYVVLLYPGFAIPGRLIGMSFFDVCRATAGSVAATFVMALCVLGVNEVMDASSSPVRLFAQAVTGAVVYAAIAHFGRVPAYRDLRGVILEQVGRRSKGSEAPAAESSD